MWSPEIRPALKVQCSGVRLDRCWGYPTASRKQLTTLDCVRNALASWSSKETRLKRGTGIIVIVLGILLAPVCVGIILIIWGASLTSNRKYYWHCRGCGRTFPA